MKGFKIFVVEDDVWYGEILAYHLSLNPEYEIERFTTGKDCLENLHKNPDAITLDYSLPDMMGSEVLQKIKSINADIPVVVISGQEDISTAVSLLKEGAYDYIVKDEETKNRIWNVIKNIRENQALKEEVRTLKEEIGKKYEFSTNIKGTSPLIKKVFMLIEKAAKTNITVSISGETGTGKELVAKSIHYNSPRKNKSFVAVNVSAIPSELIESELFGHEKGAFTGAHSRRIGKFEEANGGTIFLDEIGEMDLNMQTKLLRVLQEREITRVGGNNTLKVDVKVVVATNRNLKEEVKNGNFREDLFYRLLGLPVELPPLRDRGSDVLLLAKFFLDEFSKENKLQNFMLSSEAQDKLMKYSFPGNVRELKAIMELAAVLSNNDTIEPEHINFGDSLSQQEFPMEEMPLREYNIRIIKHMLQKYDNNVLLVAKKLDIGKSTIYRMIQNNEL